MQNVKNLFVYILLVMLLSVTVIPGSSGQSRKNSPSANSKKSAWVDPRKGKFFGKVNVVQISLTANEEHIIGKVKSVSYKDYKLSENPDSAKVLEDSGYNVYDHYGHLIDQNEYQADGQPKWKCVYMYDNKNKAVEWDFLFYYRKEAQRIIFKYDEKGRETENVTYDKDRKLVGRQIHKYDSKGNEIEDASYDGNGKPTLVFKYKYDKKGNQVELIESFSDSKRMSRMTCEYDNNRNKIRGTSYEQDSSQSTSWVNKNDDKGRDTACIYYNHDGGITRRATFKYDKWENIVQYMSYKADGSPDERYCYVSEFEYDSVGNIVKETGYNFKSGRKVAVSYTEKKYAYY